MRVCGVRGGPRILQEWQTGCIEVMDWKSLQLSGVEILWLVGILVWNHGRKGLLAHKGVSEWRGLYVCVFCVYGH